MSCFVTRAAISICFDLFRGRVFFLSFFPAKCHSYCSLLTILFSAYINENLSTQAIFSLKKTQKSKRPYFLLFAVNFLVFFSSNPNNFNNLQNIYLGYDMTILCELINNSWKYNRRNYYEGKYIIVLIVLNRHQILPRNISGSYYPGWSKMSSIFSYNSLFDLGFHMKNSDSCFIYYISISWNWFMWFDAYYYVYQAHIPTRILRSNFGEEFVKFLGFDSDETHILELTYQYDLLKIAKNINTEIKISFFASLDRIQNQK